MPKETFIPLELLAQSQNLSLDQQLLLKLHERAARRHKDFLTARAQLPRNQKNQKLLFEMKKDAEHAGQGALTFAIGYYHKHGRLEQAYDELRRTAEMHWSPAISREWEGAFVRTVLHHVNGGTIRLKDLSPATTRTINYAAKISGYSEKLAAGITHTKKREIEAGTRPRELPN